MAAPDKQRTIAKVVSRLGKVYDSSVPPDLTVLDHLIVGILQQETSLQNAADAYARLREGFFDFNEMRVSLPAEIQEMLAEIPEAQAKAKRLHEILQFVFETTYAFDLESMRKKPLKQAQKQLSKIAGATDFAVAATVQRALNGHAIPVDKAMCQIFEALELIEPGSEPADVRTALEHMIPKAQGMEFCILVSALAADTAGRDEHLAPLLPKRKRKSPQKPVDIAPATRNLPPGESPEAEPEKPPTKTKKAKHPGE